MLLKFNIDQIAAAALETKTLFAGPGSLFSIAFSHSDSMLACFSERRATVWDMSTHDVKCEFDCEWSGLPVFDRRQRLLASCDYGGVAIHDVEKNQSFAQFRIPKGPGRDFTGPILRLAFNANTTEILMLTEHCLRSWSLSSGEQLWRMDICAGEIALDAKYTSDDAGIVVTYRRHKESRRTTHICETEFPRAIRRREFSVDALSPVSISRDCGIIILMGDVDYEVWSVKRATCILRFPVASVLWPKNPISDDGRIVVEGGVRIWNLSRGECEADFQFEGGANTFCYSGKQHLAVVHNPKDYEDCFTVILRVPDGQIVGRCNCHCKDECRFSNSGRWFASVADENFLIDRDCTMPSGTVLLTDTSAERS